MDCTPLKPKPVGVKGPVVVVVMDGVGIGRVRHGFAEQLVGTTAVGGDGADLGSLGRRAAAERDAPVRLDALARPLGIGRGTHLGDTILGIKGRIGFVAPAATVLITAHHELEKLVLTKAALEVLEARFK